MLKWRETCNYPSSHKRNTSSDRYREIRQDHIAKDTPERHIPCAVSPDHIHHYDRQQSSHLLNHVNVVMSWRVPVRPLLRGRLRGLLLALAPVEVVRHLGVQLLLRLPLAPTPVTTAGILATGRVPPATRPAAAPLGHGAARPSAAAAGHVAVDTLPRGLLLQVPSRGVGARPVVRHSDPLREGSAGHHRRVEGVAAPTAALGQEGEGDALAVGIGAVEFTDRTKGVVAMLVCDECEALRSAGAVVAEVEVRYGADFLEEVLIGVSLPSRVGTS